MVPKTATFQYFFYMSITVWASATLGRIPLKLGGFGGIPMSFSTRGYLFYYHDKSASKPNMLKGTRKGGLASSHKIKASKRGRHWYTICETENDRWTADCHRPHTSLLTCTTPYISLVLPFQATRKQSKPIVRVQFLVTVHTNQHHNMLNFYQPCTYLSAVYPKFGLERRFRVFRGGSKLFWRKCGLPEFLQILFILSIKRHP